MKNGLVTADRSLAPSDSAHVQVSEGRIRSIENGLSVYRASHFTESASLSQDKVMASLFSARRKPKRVAREDASQAEVQDNGMSHSHSNVKRSSDNLHFSRRLADSQHVDNGPAVRRPGAVKNKSKLRVSFNPGHEDVQDSSNVQSENDTTAVKPATRLGPSAALQDRLKQTSLRESDETDRPSYSRSYLDELRNSTPSTPLPTSTPPDDDEQRILDIKSKFGHSKPSTLFSNNINVPSASEIAEKKARRARLAASQDPASEANPHSQSEEQDFISLEPYDSDGEFKPQRMQVGTYLQPSSTKETSIALEREDEDIAEGYEQFVEDNADAVRGRYATNTLRLDRKSRKAHTQKERRMMQQMIDKAEASHSSNDSDTSASDSASERHHAYETSQTHYGLDTLPAHATHKVKQRRPQQPRETTPTVKLSVGLNRLREEVQSITEEKARIERRLEGVRRKKIEVQERKGVVQRELEGLGREVEGLQSKEGEGGMNGDGDGGGNGNGVQERGLESIGVRRRGGDEMDVG